MTTITKDTFWSSFYRQWGAFSFVDVLRKPRGSSAPESGPPGSCINGIIREDVDEPHWGIARIEKRMDQTMRTEPETARFDNENLAIDYHTRRAFYYQARTPAWAKLREAGVDFHSTDQLKLVRDFLLNEAGK